MHSTVSTLVRAPESFVTTQVISFHSNAFRRLLFQILRNILQHMPRSIAIYSHVDIALLSSSVMSTVLFSTVRAQCWSPSTPRDYQETLSCRSHHTHLFSSFLGTLNSYKSFLTAIIQTHDSLLACGYAEYALQPSICALIRFLANY